MEPYERTRSLHYMIAVCATTKMFLRPDVTASVDFFHPQTGVHILQCGLCCDNDESPGVTLIDVSTQCPATWAAHLYTCHPGALGHVQVCSAVVVTAVYGCVAIIRVSCHCYTCNRRLLCPWQLLRQSPRWIHQNAEHL
jgi:hypothetical protein